MTGGPTRRGRGSLVGTTRRVRGSTAGPPGWFVMGSLSVRYGPHGTDGERERECDECSSRVTETASGWEAGHQYGCPNRPPEAGDKSDASGAAYYGGDS